MYLGSAVIKNLPASEGDARDVGLIPGLGRLAGVGNDKPLQYSCLKTSTDWGTWQAMVQGVTKRGTQWSTKTHTHKHTLPLQVLCHVLHSALAGKLAEAGAQSKPGMVLWCPYTSAVQGDSCWHIEVTLCPSIEESCGGVQASTDALTRKGLVSVAASLPWVPNMCFHVHTFWSKKIFKINLFPN